MNEEQQAKALANAKREHESAEKYRRYALIAEEHRDEWLHLLDDEHRLQYDEWTALRQGVEL